MRRAILLAWRSLLLFNSGLALYRIAAVTLFFVVEDDACLWIFGDGAFGASLGADGVGAMFADVHSPHEIELTVHVFRTIPPDRQMFDSIRTIRRIVGTMRGIVLFLFAGYLAGLASPAGELFDNQCIFIHGWPPSFFSG